MREQVGIPPDGRTELQVSVEAQAGVLDGRPAVDLAARHAPPDDHRLAVTNRDLVQHVVGRQVRLLLRGLDFGQSWVLKASGQ